ncbi:endonuclease NucS [Corynebacterium sp. sy039]|uniref:endonuclease NucS n=1 Tax=Corynebacterium sp. sy039 TaxID=2599641 RepID=UPI0011B53681|nr:endonuclease NucS [Corynebacterium sp. sy039]QDZ42387.1 endonuclease NucS [Corynebacterium sp. sy039]
MRLVIARCSVDYVGRLEAHLPMADRLIMIKADGSVSIHADDRAYKPLNWMTPPCTLTETEVPVAELEDAQVKAQMDAQTTVALWIVENKKGEQLRITVEAIHSDLSYNLGEDPGLIKDGVEAHLQELLAEHIDTLGEGHSLIRREYPTAIGPVDILCRNEQGQTVAVEIKRRGGIDGVEQLSRYLELLNRDELLAPVQGVFAAQEIKPQARTLANDRGIRCVTLDYDALRGIESTELRLF